MNETELLESWKERAEKLEVELQKAAALINTSRNEAAVSSVTCGQMRKELERVQASAAELREALLKRLPSLGAWENDCVLCGAHTECGDIPHKLDCPFIIAQKSSAGTGYVRKEDVMRDVKPILTQCLIFLEDYLRSHTHPGVSRIVADIKGLTE